MKIYERTLVPAVVKYFQNRGYIVFTEQYVGFRRADVLAISLDMKEVEKRIEHEVKNIPPRTFFRIMRLINKHGEMSIKELASKLGYSISYVNRIVSNASLYLHREKGMVRKIRDYKPYADEVIGTEVKVKDWKLGLVQAHQYLCAANKAYLAVPEKTYKKIPREVIEWSKNKGIGILVIYTNGEIREALKTRKHIPQSKTAYYSLLEKLWDKIHGNITRSYHGVIFKSFSASSFSLETVEETLF